MKFEWAVRVAALFLMVPVIQTRAEQPLVLDEMIVTAAMEPVRASQVAGSVTVISREEIEQKQARYLGDLLRAVPGFSVSQAGGPGAQTQVRVRGSEANHLLVLIDGIPANDAASVDEFQFQYALTSDIERIEIIRGPQSAIWGTDALSGVVNIIRRKNTESHQWGFHAETGSFGTNSAALNAAHGGEAFRAWAGLSKLELDGTNISQAGLEKDGSDNLTLNAGVNFDLAPGFTLGFTGSHVDAENQFDDIDFEVTGLPRDADRVSRIKRTYWQGEVGFTPAASPWSGLITVNQTGSDNQNYSEGAWSDSTAADTTEFRARLSLHLLDAAARDHRLSVMLDRQRVKFSQRGLAFPPYDPNQDQSFDVKGFAVEYSVEASDRLDWTISGRKDRFSNFDDADTWQTGASFRVRENLRLRASLGTGAKAPTFTDRYGFYEGLFVGNPALKPETSFGWEAGLDAWLKNEAFRLQAVYFDQDLEDEIDGFVYEPASGFFTAKNKQNSSSRRGFEVSLDTISWRGLTAGVNYTYTRATETDSAGLRVAELRRPAHMANLSLNYLFPDDRTRLNLNSAFTGSQSDVFFSPLTYLSEIRKLPGFVVIDLAATFQLNDSLELVARINNLMDEQYEEILGFARPGRAIYAGLRGRLKY